MNLEQFIRSGFSLIEEYRYNDISTTYILKKKEYIIFIDENLTLQNKVNLFDYQIYCSLQNKYVKKYKNVLRFLFKNEVETKKEIDEWIEKDVDEIENYDNGGYFDKQHYDNSVAEANFESIFEKAYGNDATCFLKKEYSVSLGNGHTAFIDYVVETKKEKYAFEINGVNYHHPLIIGENKYSQQLSKQNTLIKLGFYVYRFSTNNLAFESQVIDDLKSFLENKENFIVQLKLINNRQVSLYDHQVDALNKLDEDRKKGIYTQLFVYPMGTGKSEIGIQDITRLAKEHKITNALIMVPSLKIKLDWINRIRVIDNLVRIKVALYNEIYKERNILSSNYYDYILFDEAHHAMAANCKKTLEYFQPKFLLGMTATPDRLDKQNLSDIFGKFETNLSVKKAIEKNIIVDIRCYRLESNIDLSDVRYNGKDFSSVDLEKRVVVNSRNELIASTIKKYFYPQTNFYKQGIVFCVNINHAKSVANLLNKMGITARAVYGSNPNNDKIFEEYKNKKIQFLCSCQLISEGWDSPQTEVVIMARPTLSKVLYQQQFGRGTRKYPGKECLWLIDVVDNYGGELRPWTFNSYFHIPTYSAFSSVMGVSLPLETINILGLSEEELALKEIDIFTFEEKYGDYLSLEQASRELFIGTNTLAKWVKKNPMYSSLSLPIGNKKMPYFSKDDIRLIREDKKLSVHDETTIKKDFIDFINENTLTFSFKLIFILGMFYLANDFGEVKIDELTKLYSEFYLKRIERKLPVDRKNCIYNEEYLKDKIKMKKSILDNPFEKYERKRFVYYSKDLSLISFNRLLWNELTIQDKDAIINKEKQFLKEYYLELGGVYEQDYRLLSKQW